MAPAKATTGKTVASRTANIFRHIGSQGTALVVVVISVCQGEKIPRKGGPAITRSDLLIINKADLAPHVMADLGVMERDAQVARAGRPFVFTDLLRQKGLADIVSFIERQGGLAVEHA